MLPCQGRCPNFTPGCHKSCSQWKRFLEEQREQRAEKKKYMQFYNDLCTAVTRQFYAIGTRPARW